MGIVISTNISQFGFNYPLGSDWVSTFGEIGTAGGSDTTGTCIVNGTLLLDGDLVCQGDIEVTSLGMVIPVPDRDLKKEYFSLDTFSYITANGGSREMKSTTGDILVDGFINGRGAGFESNKGPGCNSLSVDSSGNENPGFGATHAGRGFIS